MENDWTEQEIRTAATKDWLGVLAQLWTAIGKPLEKDRLEVYKNSLQNVPLGLLELAIDRLFREQTWSIVPTIGKVWEAVRKELGYPYDLDSALAEWSPKLKGRTND